MLIYDRMKVALHAALCLSVLASVNECYSQGRNEAAQSGFNEALYPLQQMKEPQLPQLAKDQQAEAYRIMIFPTWGNAISVRAEKHDGIYALSSRRLDGQAGFQSGRLVEEKDFDLTAADSRILERLIQELAPFQIPSSDATRGFDGDEWVLEIVSQGKYRVIERWCATDYNPKKRGLLQFNALCKFLVDKSKLSVRPTNKGHKLI